VLAGRVVERRQLDQLGDPLRDPGIDDNRVAKSRAAVDDPVRDGIGLVAGLGERVERNDAVVGRDEAQLQARRAGVDDQNR